MIKITNYRLIAEEGKKLQNTETLETGYVVIVTEDNVDKWVEVENIAEPIVEEA